MHSAHTIWGAMEKEVVESDWVENFPFLVFVFEAGWCQVPIWNEGWPQGGSRLEVCWPKSDQFHNKLQMSNSPHWSTNILTTPFWSSSLFQIFRQTARASQTHCLRYQLYEVVPRVMSPSQVSYVSDAVSYVSYVSYSRAQTVLGACSSYQQPLLLMLYSQRICTWLFNCVPFLALLGFFFSEKLSGLSAKGGAPYIR